MKMYTRVRLYILRPFTLQRKLRTCVYLDSLDIHPIPLGLSIVMMMINDEHSATTYRCDDLVLLVY